MEMQCCVLGAAHVQEMHGATCLGERYWRMKGFCHGPDSGAHRSNSGTSLRL